MHFGNVNTEWSDEIEILVDQLEQDSAERALSAEERTDRADALTAVTAPTPEADAMLKLLTAAELGADNPAEAAENLLTLSDRGDIPQIYRQVATLKAVMLPDAGLDPTDRRQRLEDLTLASGLLRLLAEEQIAMLDIEEGNSDAAITRLQELYVDAEASQGLRERVSGVIVALGGDLTE